MNLMIDGMPVQAQPNQTLLQLLNESGLDNDSFSRRPLAAKIAGEVYSLNYVPVRPEDAHRHGVTTRRAMVASGGVINLIRYCDPAGKDLYVRTAHFLIFFALHRLYPGVRAKMNCTVGKALYIEVCSDSFLALKLKDELKRIVSSNMPIRRRRIATAEAAESYMKSGREDKARLLQLQNDAYFDEYYCDDFSDCYYGELAPSTGYLQVWDLIPTDGGFMFLFPDDNDPVRPARYAEMPKFLSVSNEGEKWCQLMGCETVADLNAHVTNGKIRELIRVNEALHEKRFSQVADMICQRKAKVVMLAGPSSSGKTTSANRLAIQLKVHGMQPVLMSLDDYYIDRDQIVPEPDGTIDLEHINTIDVELFSRQLNQLLHGQKVELPHFNFKTGKREWNQGSFQMQENAVIIVEGLHALNPVLLPDGLEKNVVFKFYVSPLLPLNLDDHNRIPTNILRLLRRTVRDYENRGSSVQNTMAMWDSVRRGEQRWIFPFQESADVIFNSSTLYELAVLKKYIYPLLAAIQPEDECYDQVDGLVRILNYVQQADVDDEIPPNSLVREFIGGNTFYK